MLGITNFDYEKHQQIVKNFCDLARTGHVMAGDPPGHGDGWGMAFTLNDQWKVHKSGANLLKETDKFLNLLRCAEKCPVLILHLRKSAWSNTATARHAHPFQYKNAVFAHNGTITNYQGLIRNITVPGLAEDALDTEVFFLHVMSDPSPDLSQAFKNSVSTIKRDYAFSALNCLFSDGRKLFAYRDYSKEPDYYSLFKASFESSCVISSQPLAEDLSWELMEKEELLVA
jgi:predicted glutamine amidotransferase